MFSSTSFPYVLYHICQIDTSIKYNPILFIGYISDLYRGDRDVESDFITILHSLNSTILDSTITEKILTTIKLHGRNQKQRVLVQKELMKFIYIKSSYSEISRLEEMIDKVYVNSSLSKSDNLNIYEHSSRIISFESSHQEAIEHGQILTFTWNSCNAYKLILNSGSESMDVTHIDSIDVCALFDAYSLILYDKHGCKIEEKKIILNFIENVFCVNCGTHIFRPNDIFCTHCGMKLL